MNSIVSLLECRAADLAGALDLPLGLEGRPFVVPAGPHLRCSVNELTVKGAGIGRHTPARIDGTLKITVVCMAGQDLASRLAGRVMAFFPRGSSLAYDGALGTGELVFAAPARLAPDHGAGRTCIAVTVAFYAIIFPKNAGSPDRESAVAKRIKSS